MVLDKLAEGGFAAQRPCGGAEDVVGVWEEAGEVGGGERGGDDEDVPDV